MKTSFYLTTICLIALSVFLFWAKPYHNDHDISIAVNERINRYAFTASFPTQNTVRVWSYLNDRIVPSQISSHGADHFDGDIILNDMTMMRLKESPGELKIEVDKSRNSTNSLNRVKSICAGIKTLLCNK